MDGMRGGAGQPLLRQLVEDLQQAEEVGPLVRVKVPALHQDILHVATSLQTVRLLVLFTI